MTKWSVNPPIERKHSGSAISKIEILFYLIISITNTHSNHTTVRGCVHVQNNEKYINMYVTCIDFVLIKQIIRTKSVINIRDRPIEANIDVDKLILLPISKTNIISPN